MIGLLRAPLAVVLTLVACTSAAPPRAAVAPWDANPPVVAPQVTLDEWRKAENRATCAPMTLADVRGTARRANFSGGWAVAWDVPGQPGRDPSGASCETCGRGVYGIAGAGITWGSDAHDAGFPHRRDWSDGQWAGYALEGGTGPNWLAQVRVADETCVYYVWSFLGREHLEQLLDQVRRVKQ